MGMRIEETRSPSGAASEVIMKTLTDECGRFSVPIDVTEAAQKVGIEVKRLRLDDATDGLLVKDRPNRPFKAVVDSFSHEHRARFTLAHELGHYIHRYQDIPDGVVVGKVERRDTRSSLGIDGEEIWANRFAAALLMPPWSQSMSEAATVRRKSRTCSMCQSRRSATGSRPWGSMPRENDPLGQRVKGCRREAVPCGDLGHVR